MEEVDITSGSRCFFKMARGVCSELHFSFTDDWQIKDNFCHTWVTSNHVSDKGPPFSSSEFESFMKAQGIVHCRVLPYCPSSNWLTENMVKTLKQALNKSAKSDTIETKIAKFLATYRNAPLLVTGRIPAEDDHLELNFHCLSQKVSLTMEKWVDDKSPRMFEVGQMVLLCDLHPAATSKRRLAVTYLS